MTKWLVQSLPNMLRVSNIIVTSEEYRKLKNLESLLTQILELWYEP